MHANIHVMWAELAATVITWENVIWAELGGSHFLIVTRETGTKNDFQRNILFRNQLSDYGATKVSLYST